MSAVGTAKFRTDGNSVPVSLLYTVAKDRIAVVDGWCGIAASDGDSGDDIYLTVDDREYLFTVPAGLSVTPGVIVYIEVADVTGHYPDDTAFSTSAGAGKVAFFKATGTKNADNLVPGVMLGRGQLAS